MTTIAANRECMAADSRTSEEAEFITCDDKIEIIGGSIIACTGKVSEIFKFLHWFKDQTLERPEIDEDEFIALELNKKGLFIYWGTTYASRICNKFHAIGSGGMAAKAAMICGKTPAEAVAVALKCDKNSDGPVRVAYLNKGKPAFAKRKNADT